MTDNDPRQLHRDALRVATSYIERIDASDLGRSTPCIEWDLQHLLEHMVGQHLGFAQAVRAGDAPAGAYRPVPFTPAAWSASVEELIAAFAAADLDARVLELELDPEHPLPVSFLVLAQLLDTVVHTWDVAVSLGDAFTPAPHMLTPVVALANGIPDDERRDLPHAAFAHPRAVDGEPWERALAALGRDPAWTAVPRAR
jgi:uncharacterized protein (TIGR03086 family)